MSKSNFVSKEISHLMKSGPSKGPQKGKKMPQKQAVAVALNVAREKGIKESLGRSELRLLREMQTPYQQASGGAWGQGREAHYNQDRKAGLAGDLASIEKLKQAGRYPGHGSAAPGSAPAPKPPAPKPPAPIAKPPAPPSIFKPAHPGPGSTSPGGSPHRPFKRPFSTMEDSPPGWHGTVRAMKTHGHVGKGDDQVDNPYALAWWMKNRGEKAHYKDQETSMEGRPEKKDKYKDEGTMSIFDDIIDESRLTTTGRKHIKKGNFALPGKKGSKAGKGSYPIHDKAHARNALSRVSQFGSSAEKAKVRAAVHKKFPGIGDDKKEESVSIFDSLVERELPEAFKKNMSRFKLGGKKDDDEGEEREEREEKGGEGCDGDMECESTSIFDALVQESSGSLFDSLVEQTETKPQKASSWDDRMARTLTLAEELVALRNTGRQ